MSKRIISIFISVITAFVGISGRIGYISLSKTYEVSNTYNNYSLLLDNKEANIYYRDRTKATNNKTIYAIIIRPNPKCIGELDKVFSADETKEIIEELKSGYPVVRYLDEKPDVNYLRVENVYDSDNTLPQLLNKSSSGLLSKVDNVGTKEILFSIDANGKILDGDAGTINEENYDSYEGYIISIDKDIQDIVYNATKDLTSGCVIVMNVEDNSILALVNKPDDTYLNKAFSKYAVGSVFKLAIALCAIENNVDLTYNCTGSISVGSLNFSCQKNHIHGSQNLKLALANSCNCYFVNLANKLGKSKIIATLNKLGFYDKTEFFDNWIVENATVPSSEELNVKGQLSLLGFGQGKLTVTPFQIASFLCTVGNYGVKNEPRLVIGTVNNINEKSQIEYPKGESVVSSESCKILLEYMRYVVSNGTGINAESSDKKSSGKTATAQTGQYLLGSELLNTWFAGIYPYDNPKYAIVIMKEQGKSGSQDCCPIFSTIVEQLQNM